MSTYTVPALDAVDFALEVHTVPSLASPETALQSYTVPTLTAANFALASYTPPTYMVIGWDLAPSGAPPVTGTMTFASELAASALGIGGVTTAARPRLSNRTLPPTPGPLTLSLARAPRGVRAPSPLFRR